MPHERPLSWQFPVWVSDRLTERRKIPPVLAERALGSVPAVPRWHSSRWTWTWTPAEEATSSGSVFGEKSWPLRPLRWAPKSSSGSAGTGADSPGVTLTACWWTRAGRLPRRGTPTVLDTRRLTSSVPRGRTFRTWLDISGTSRTAQLVHLTDGPLPAISVVSGKDREKFPATSDVAEIRTSNATPVHGGVGRISRRCRSPPASRVSGRLRRRSCRRHRRFYGTCLDESKTVCWLTSFLQRNLRCSSSRPPRMHPAAASGHRCCHARPASRNTSNSVPGLFPASSCSVHDSKYDKMWRSVRLSARQLLDEFQSSATSLVRFTFLI